MHAIATRHWRAFFFSLIYSYCTAMIFQHSCDNAANERLITSWPVNDKGYPTHMRTLWIRKKKIKYIPFRLNNSKLNSIQFFFLANETMKYMENFRCTSLNAIDLSMMCLWVYFFLLSGKQEVLLLKLLCWKPEYAFNWLWVNIS